VPTVYVLCVRQASLVGTMEQSKVYCEWSAISQLNFGIRVALVKLILAQIVMKFDDFYGSECSLPWSSKPTTEPWPTLIQSDFHTFYKRYDGTASSDLYLGSRSTLCFRFPVKSATRFVYGFCCMCLCWTVAADPCGLASGRDTYGFRIILCQWQSCRHIRT